jgi:hypothetical protein
MFLLIYHAVVIFATNWMTLATWNIGVFATPPQVYRLPQVRGRRGQKIVATVLNLSTTKTLSKESLDYGQGQVRRACRK